MNLPSIDISKKTGLEEFLGCSENKTILNFWQWAYSDLISNTERGCLAEYMVALACGVDDKIRVSWDTYDLITKNGIRVEVKSSAYLQTWQQNGLSKPIYGIPQTISWDHKANIYGTERKRHADVYVFALLAHLDKSTLNPLDVNQWEFYVLNTKVIDRELANTRHVSLKKLVNIGAIKCGFGELNMNIEAVFINV